MEDPKELRERGYVELGEMRERQEEPAPYLPEGHDNQSCHDENDGEDNEEVIAGVLPSRVVKHLGRL